MKGKNLSYIIGLPDEAALSRYFMTYALGASVPTAPGKSFCIRLGRRVIWAERPEELRRKFYAGVDAVRSRQGVRA